MCNIYVDVVILLSVQSKLHIDYYIFPNHLTSIFRVVIVNSLDIFRNQFS